MKRPADPPHRWACKGSIRSHINKRFLGMPYGTADSALLEISAAAPPVTLRGEWNDGKPITLFEHPGYRVVIQSRRRLVKRPKLFGFIPLPRANVRCFALPDDGSELEITWGFFQRTYVLNSERIDLERQIDGEGRWYRSRDFDLYVPREPLWGHTTFSFREPSQWLLAALCAYVEYVEARKFG